MLPVRAVAKGAREEATRPLCLERSSSPKDTPAHPASIGTTPSPISVPNDASYQDNKYVRAPHAGGIQSVTQERWRTKLSDGSTSSYDDDGSYIYDDGTESCGSSSHEHVPTTQNYAPGCRYPATAVPPRRYFRRQLLSTATGRDFQTLHRHASEGSEPGCALQSAPRRSFISAIGRRHYQLLQGHQTQAKVSIRRQAGRWTYLYKFGTAVAWGERGTCRTGVASISCNRLSSVQNLHRPRVVMLPRSSLSRRGCSVRRRSAGNDKQLASLGASPPPMAIRAARSCSSSRQNASILVR
jgi:hypothetical protein